MVQPKRHLPRQHLPKQHLPKQSTDAEHVERLSATDVDERHIPEINDEVLAELITDETDAVVAMLEDDDENLYDS